MTLDLILASLTLVCIFVVALIITDKLFDLVRWIDALLLAKRLKKRWFYVVPRNDDFNVMECGRIHGYGLLIGGRWINGVKECNGAGLHELLGQYTLSKGDGIVKLGAEND